MKSAAPPANFASSAVTLPHPANVWLRISSAQKEEGQTLAGCGKVTAEDAKFAGGAADFIQGLIELGNVTCFDVNEKLIFPRATVDRTAFNLEQIDAVPCKWLQ